MRVITPPRQKLPLIFLLVFCQIIFVFILYQIPKSNKRIFSSTNKKTKIAIWISPTQPPRQQRMDRLEKIVTTQNTNNGEICKITKKEFETDEEHCHFSLTNGSIEDADSVVFFMFTDGFKLSALPNLTNQIRPPQQLWIQYSREPPPLSFWYDPLKNIFNWTMSYRSDSDVYVPYGKILPKIPEIPENSPILIEDISLEQWISQKSKFIAGVISNCNTQSKRETLVSQMQNISEPYGRIDIFGKCGTGQVNVCGRYAENCTEFWTNIAKDYKFYLGFENSLCSDYITEKFWRPLQTGIVPVVYGLGNYNFQGPPNSFINVDDFKSVEDLMKHLKYLDENNSEYAKYFQWRRNYRIQNNGGMVYDWCDLCKAVKNYKNELSNKSLRKTYKNSKEWWQHKVDSNESICENPPEKLIGFS